MLENRDPQGDCGRGPAAQPGTPHPCPAAPTLDLCSPDSGQRVWKGVHEGWDIRDRRGAPEPLSSCSACPHLGPALAPSYSALPRPPSGVGLLGSPTSHPSGCTHPPAPTPTSQVFVKPDVDWQQPPAPAGRPSTTLPADFETHLVTHVTEQTAS